MNKQSIKVLRVVTRLNVGGPARQIDSLVDFLDPMRFEQVVVFGSVADGEAENSLVADRDQSFVRVAELGRSVSLLSDVKAFLRLVGTIRKERPDIVHTHLAKAGLLGRVAAWLCRVPVRVHTFHGHLLTGYFTGIKLKLYIMIERTLRRITTYQICVGERVRQDLIEAGIVAHEASGSVFPGIKPPALVPRGEARRSLKIDEETFVVLFVGRLVEIKRLDRFVHAINELTLTHPRAKAVVVGDGPERDTSAALMRDPNNFLFVGWKDDLGLFYSAADIVCLTSDNEGMPIALIEAALSGIPAVTTDAGSAREVVCDGQSGIVVPIDDFDKLVSALRIMATDVDRRILFGTYAREFATATFSGQRLASDHATLYDSLLARRA